MILLLLLVAAQVSSLQVKTLYLVPSDKLPMPNYEKDLNEIMDRMQEWYARELHGRTFDYIPVEKIDIPLTEAEMKSGTKAGFGADAERMSVWRNAEQFVMDKFGKEYREEKMIMNVFVEVDIWVALGGSGLAVFGDGEQKLSDRGPNWFLSAFPHEIGHALGLAHTQATLDCLALEDADGTFMDSAITWSYEYELDTYQKQLLLDPDYHPNCLMLTDLEYRPHPSEYLTCNRSPDINGDGKVDVNDMSIILVNYGSCDGCVADLNCDGVVDVTDLSLLLVNYG